MDITNKMLMDLAGEAGIKGSAQLSEREIEGIQRKAENDRTAWGLNEYRKNAPQELKNNPALYTRLLEEQHEKATRKENTNK